MTVTVYILSFNTHLWICDSLYIYQCLMIQTFSFVEMFVNSRCKPHNKNKSNIFFWKIRRNYRWICKYLSFREYVNIPFNESIIYFINIYLISYGIRIYNFNKWDYLFVYLYVCTAYTLKFHFTVIATSSHLIGIRKKIIGPNLQNRFKKKS